MLTFSPEARDKHEGFHSTFFAQLVEMEHYSFWFQARNKLIVWAMKEYFRESRSLLEIGCGTGFVLSGIKEHCPEVSLAGCEVYIEGLKHAANRVPDAFLFQTDARSIPFEAEFDVVGAFDVIEHIVEDENVLKQAYKAIRPGGGLILTVPHHRFLWSKQDESACHVRRYEKDELRDKVKRCGFEVVVLTAFVALLLPLMMASRSIKYKNNLDDPIDALKINPMANRLCKMVMGIERSVIQAGCRFPVGGSLLLVAKKIGAVPS